MPRAGDTICGEIRLQRAAAEDMGAPGLRPVFLATTAKGQRAWVTIIDHAFVPTSMDLSRFMAGANALLDLREVGAAPVVLVDREDAYCVVGYDADTAPTLSEVAAGGSMRRMLASWSVELARTLARLHRQGLQHGALGPGTVLVLDGHPVIWQHGIAALLVPEVYGPAARARGDLLAPEVVAGEPVSPAADVFGWGVVMAVLATGLSASEAVAEIGVMDTRAQRRLYELVDRALDPDPGRRPTDGTRLLQALVQALRPQLGPPAPGVIRPAWSSGAEDRGDSAAARAAERALAELPPVPQATGRGSSSSVSVPIVFEAEEAPVAVALQKPRPPPQPTLDDLEFDLVDDAVPASATVAAPTHAAAPVPREPERPPAWLRPSPEPDHGRGAASLDSPEELGDGLRKRKVREPATAASYEQVTPADPLQLQGPSPTFVEPTRSQPPPPPAPGPRPPVATPLPRATTSAPTPARPFQPRPPRSPTPAHWPTHPEAPPPPPPPPIASVPEPTPAIRAARPIAAFVRPRGPGPHGPSAAWMTVLLGAAVVSLVGATTWASVREAGGLQAWLGLPTSTPTADTPHEEAPPVHTVSPCPLDTVEIADRPTRACIELHEYPGADELPRVGVAFVDAQRLCAERRRRLCTADEWRAACGGPEDWRYPYGAERERERCAAPDDGRVRTTGVDPTCVTPSGVHDLVGNAAEWVADGVLLGGGAAQRSSSCTSRSGSARDRPDEHTGLRCCVDASP